VVTTNTLSFSLMLSKGALTVHERSIYRLILYIIPMDLIYIERILNSLALHLKLQLLSSPSRNYVA
jgi:hypothetical protein